MHLVNSSVHGNEIVGGLAGRISDSTTVIGCSVEGTIEGTNNIGGLIGQVSGYYLHLVSDCYSTCAVSGQEYVGV
ncbi:MAG TPA: GLUG motif-containing protein [Chitinispirillaceae bacterium]|nr:GLUG motif-containing protein [Chitinispirillaceae bacterium]